MILPRIMMSSTLRRKHASLMHSDSPGRVGALAPLGSRVSPGTTAATNGRRDSRGNDWAFTPQRKLRRGRTTSTSRTAVRPNL